MKTFTSDFETRNSNEDIECGKTSVWLWDCCDLEGYKHTYGFDIETWFDFACKNAPCKIYFHNLKFDGYFILDFLLRHGYKHSQEKKLNKNEFSTLITESNMFYSIKICVVKGKKKQNITLWDSLKKINAPVARIATSFNLPCLKGEIEYKKQRDFDYIPTSHEIEYVRNDTEIVARALNILFEQGLEKMTSASDALHRYKEVIGGGFNHLFIEMPIEIDDYIRQSYRGGVAVVNPIYQNKVVKNVNVFDVNSMYPAMMLKLLPYGKPEFFTGEYNGKRPLHISRVRVDLCVKPKHFPSILLTSARSFSQNYLYDTKGEYIEITLTSIDLSTMFKNYDVYDIEYIDGYAFWGSTKLFHDYIEPIYKKKCETTGAYKETMKLLLNSLYGKFATNPRKSQKAVYLDDIVKLEVLPMEIDKTVYTACSSFITAYAREFLFDEINAQGDNFVYCDTDSIHTLGDSVDNMDNVRLGAWKFEKRYDSAKYLRSKAYMGIIDGKRDIKLAGCPANVKQSIEMNEFEIGNKFEGKKMPRVVRGGVVLVDVDFTIKRR